MVGNCRGTWLGSLAAAGLVAAALLGARALPADPGGGAPGALQGIGGPRGSGGGVQGSGGFPQGGVFPGIGGGVQGIGGGVQGSGGGVQGSGGGVQGGVFPGGGVSSLQPGETLRVAAFCTDLLADAPDASTRFSGGGAGGVRLADGRATTLAAALGAGILTLRGRDDSFDPARRDGRLLLDLYLTNRASVPVRLELLPGSQVEPEGHGARPLPPEADRLFAAAARLGLTYSNTLQCAVWAARGSTVEEVEQANLVSLPRQEVGRVQDLLAAAGIDRRFDRERGRYAGRYRDEARRLESAAAGRVSGEVVLPIGGRAALEGWRDRDGQGVVKLRVRQSRAEFFHRARFDTRPDGRPRVRLLHLVTGRPMRANGAEFTLAAAPAGG